MSRIKNAQTFLISYLGANCKICFIFVKPEGEKYLRLL